MAPVILKNLATTLIILLGVASRGGCSRSPELESLKRTPHSLFIDTRTHHWGNVTNPDDSNPKSHNDFTLNETLKEISLKEYLAVNFGLSGNDSITYSRRKIKNDYRNLNNNNSANKNILNNNTNKNIHFNIDNNNNDNNDKIYNINSNVTNGIGNIKEFSSTNKLKLPPVVENKSLFMNAFRNKDFTPHNDKSPHLKIDNDSNINTHLVNTWAKMRRSAVQSTDSQIIPQKGDGVIEADILMETRRLAKRSEVADDLRQRFNFFKEFLATTTNTSPTETDSLKRITNDLFGERRKTVRKAGEVIGMVESGALPVSEHPILFLPTPQRTVTSQAPLHRGASVESRIGQTAGRGGSFTSPLRLGSSRTPPHITRTPVHYVSPLQTTPSPGMSPELVRLLQARLGTTSRRVHYDSSIIVDFLTLVSLSQRHNSGDSGVVGRSRTSQREATQFGSSSDQTFSPLMSIPSRRHTSSHQLNSGHHHQGEFGPFSDGNDPAAGIDPSNIAFPPQLRQTLYSYLLPRLPALGALLDTVPGVPGLDYPIIAAVPYTNFYCLDMPWPGFYADTEARCQTWHYCDLEGRQSSFLCPNGTVFNQAFLVCDWWYNFDCQTAPFLYSINERVFDVPEIDETAPHRTLTPEILDTLFV